MKNLSFTVFPNENFLDLRLFQFGWEVCKPLHSFGPYVRNHFLFHYVVSGTGTLISTNREGKNTTYQLYPDQGFLISPGQVNSYCADQSDPWKYVWLEFDGLRADEYVGDAGLTFSQPIYLPTNLELAHETRDAMFYITDHPDSPPLRLIGHLYLFLDRLIQSSSTRQKTQESQLRDFYMQEAVQYMKRNFNKAITVDDVASVCGLNRSYFSKLFKECMGCPPQEFLIRLRLSKATELMENTNRSIGDIAAECGYPNQLHFSRAFRKYFDIPPREWRAKKQG